MGSHYQRFPKMFHEAFSKKLQKRRQVAGGGEQSFTRDQNSLETETRRMNDDFFFFSFLL